MTLTHGGRACALATNAGVVYAPEVSALEPDHPRRRFVGALCLYARDVRVGAAPGPYDAEAAAFYARTLLVDDERFELLGWLSDAELAEHFNVPLEQVRLKRTDPLGRVGSASPGDRRGSWSSRS